MIDTHCHINFDTYNANRNEVLERAYKSGVERLVIPGTNWQTCCSAIALAENHKEIYAAVGIHPTDVADVDESTYQNIERGLNHAKVVALGEVGMDLYHDSSLKKKQIECMYRFVDLAKSKDKPLIIHNRDSQVAMKHFLESVTLRSRAGVFHCFSGDIDFAQFVIDKGFYISFTGVITFKNAQLLQKVAQYVPLDRILLETDSPFLTPHPYRGQCNEPAYVKLVAEKIAEIKNISFEEVDSVTTCNAQTLFDF